MPTLYTLLVQFGKLGGRFFADAAQNTEKIPVSFSSVGLEDDSSTYSRWFL